jgi:hypothetical protein
LTRTTGAYAATATAVATTLAAGARARCAATADRTVIIVEHAVGASTTERDSRKSDHEPGPRANLTAESAHCCLLCLRSTRWNARPTTFALTGVSSIERARVIAIIVVQDPIRAATVRHHDHRRGCSNQHSHEDHYPLPLTLLERGVMHCFVSSQISEKVNTGPIPTEPAIRG